MSRRSKKKQKPPKPPAPSAAADSDALDLGDWEPEEAVALSRQARARRAEATRVRIPEGMVEPVEVRAAEAPVEVRAAAGAAPGPIPRDAAPRVAANGPLPQERVTYQSNPDLFLKSLVILETALRLRQKHGVEMGQPPTHEDMLQLATSTLEALPIDIDSNKEFLVEFVANAIGSAQKSVVGRRFQVDLDREKPNVLPEELATEGGGKGVPLHVRPADAGPVPIPAEMSEAMASVSSGWGKNAFDLGDTVVTFDEGRAVIDDVRRIPGLGKVFFSEDGRFRSKLWGSVGWGVWAAAFALLGMVMVASIHRLAPEPPKEESLVDEALYDSPDFDKLEAVLDGFIGAENWEAQRDHIRLPGLMAPKMRKMHETQRFRWNKDYALLQANLEIINDIPQVLALVEIEPIKEKRAILVEVTKEGEYLVDWEYAELWQEVPWESFRLREDSTPAVLLAVLRPGHYYNYQFMDREVYQCWELLDPAEKGMSFYGYSKRDSEVGRTLVELVETRILTKRTTLLTAVLELRHPENAEDPMQVEIMDVVEKSPLRRH